MINYRVPYQYFYICHMHYYYNSNFVECLLTRVKSWMQEITIRIWIIRIWWDSNWYNLFADSLGPNLKRGSGIRILVHRSHSHTSKANMDGEGHNVLIGLVTHLKSNFIIVSLWLLTCKYMLMNIAPTGVEIHSACDSYTSHAIAYYRYRGLGILI